MTEELRKKRVRAGHRTSATRMVNRAEELLAEVQGCHSWG